MAIRDTIETLLARYDQALREAFLAAIDDIRNGVTLRAVVERLERGDIAGAVEAIGLDPVSFERVERIIAEAYADGGQAEVANLPLLRDPAGARVVFRFGTRDTDGERRLREHSSTLVREIVADQRVAIRETLEAGLAAGRNPRKTALDVVGRVSRATNRREGGIIGLTSTQAGYVSTARDQLTSGSAEDLKAYLTRTRRDKRFDPTVRKAIETGNPVPADVVDRITARYSDRLLELRGEVIARTETMGALARGRYDAIVQQITSGKIEAQDVTKVWLTAKDERVRGTHRALDGKKVGFDGFFSSPSGAMLRHPHDASAPASETVGCRCMLTYKVSYIDALARRRAA